MSELNSSQSTELLSDVKNSQNESIAPFDEKITLADKTNKKKDFNKKPLNNIWSKNLLISYGMGLIPAVVASVSVGSSLTFTLLLGLILIPTYITASLIKLKKPLYFRLPIYALISAIFFIPAIFITKLVFNIQFQASIMLYCYLLVMDAIVIERSDVVAKDYKVKDAFIEAVINTLMFGVITFTISVVREILSTGEIFGFKLIQNSASVVRLPMFGFIFLGLLLALINSIRNFILKRKNKENGDLK